MTRLWLHERRGALDIDSLKLTSRNIVGELGQFPGYRQFLIWIAFESWKDLLQCWILDIFARQHFLGCIEVFSPGFGRVTFMFCLDGLACVIGFVYCYEGFPGFVIKKLQSRPLWSFAASSISSFGISLTLSMMSAFPALARSEGKNGAMELCVDDI